jgi:hypothetical protein
MNCVQNHSALKIDTCLGNPAFSQDTSLFAFGQPNAESRRHLYLILKRRQSPKVALGFGQLPSA